MSDTAYYRGELRGAFPKWRYGGAKGAIYAAYRFIAPKVAKQFTERRARSIWEGTAARIDAEEADAIRLAKIEEARREYRELCARLSTLDEALARMDEDFTGPYRDALSAAMRGRGIAPAGQGDAATGFRSLDRARDRP